MNSSNAARTHGRAAILSLALGALFQTRILVAQELDTPPPIDTHLSSIVMLFSEIDSKAERCVVDQGSQHCETFIHALDSEFIEAYLGHCREVTNWVDQIVSQAMGQSAAIKITEATPQRLIQAEYTCGKDALRKRTNFVVEAFGKWQLSNAGNREAAGTSSPNLSPDYDVTRSIQSQNSRLSQEIDQQWQRIELENIRQQLRRQ